MKKNSTLSLLLALTLTILLSPFTGSAQLRYGFRFGGTIAKASLTKAPEMSLKNGSGFSGGLLLEYQMENCGFAPDIALLYTRYSFKMMDEDSNPVKVRRNFIEIPLHLKYKFPLSSSNNLVAPMVYTGPSLLVRLGKNASEQFMTKAVQPGWDLGIGIDIVNFIQLSAGYRFGLGNAVSRSLIPEASLHTNSWNVAANIIFDF